MDDFDRDVYCLVGLPFDAVDLDKSICILSDAVKNRTRCFLSTPNLNFLIASRSDPEFYNSVVHSDLVVADGMPLVWIARLLHLPIRERVAGSSIFEALRAMDSPNPISVYFFGGPDGVAEMAAQKINQIKGGLDCVGYQSPGFASVAAMSHPSRIVQINASNADFLIVSLGAKKGQSWIVKNLPYIDTPVVSHLGAVVNFVANKLQRAPVWMQQTGLEWLWRIKEEPALIKRYMFDGMSLLSLLATNVIPYALWLAVNQRRLARSSRNMSVDLDCGTSTCRLIITGVVLDPISPEIRCVMRRASQRGLDIAVDLTDAAYLSPGFLGMLLMLKKSLDKHALKLSGIGAQPKMKQLMKWNGLDELLE